MLAVELEEQAEEEEEEVVVEDKWGRSLPFA